MRPSGPTCAVVVVGVLSACVMGCSTSLYSPPANAMPFDAPRALDVGRTSIGLSGGKSGALFGPRVSTGTLAARRGVAEGVEAELDATLLHVHGESQTPVSREIGALRVGAKLELGTPHFAATGGLGGGTSAGGGFVSPDLGLVVGYDNTVLIPFFALRAMLSSPLGAQLVDVTPAGTPAGTYVGRPHFTQIIAGTLGARLPLGDAHAKGVSGALFAGLSVTKLYSHGDQEGFLGAGGGGEVSF